MNGRVTQGSKRQQRRTTSDRYFSSSDDDDDDDDFNNDKAFDADEFDRVATKVVATRKNKLTNAFSGSTRKNSSNAMIRGAAKPATTSSSTISLFTTPTNKLFKSVPLSTAGTDDTAAATNADDEENLSVTLTEYQRKVSFVCAEHDQCSAASSQSSLNTSHKPRTAREAREQYNAFMRKKRRRKQVIAITLMILVLVIALIVGISMGVTTRKERSSSVVSIADEEEELNIVNNNVTDAATDDDENIHMEVDADSTLTVNQQDEDEDEKDEEEEDGRQEDDEYNSVYPLNDDAQENVVIAEKPVIGNDGDLEEENNDDDNNNNVGHGNLSTVDGDMEDNINDSSLSPTYNPTDEPSPKPSSPVTAQPSPSPTDEPTKKAKEEEEEELDDEDNLANSLVDDYPLIDDTVENVVNNPNKPISAVSGEEENNNTPRPTPRPTDKPTKKPTKKVVEEEEEEEKENEQDVDTISVTCGKGKQGNGICPIQGECCSKFGWCGNTVEHCSSTSSSLVGGTTTTANSNTNSEVSNPNADAGNPNNIITLSTLSDTVFAAAKIDIPANSHLTIKLKTDAHGEETSWTLHSVDDKTNAQMKLISSVNENTYGPSEEDVVELDLAPGKYRFTLKDAFGDGGTESYAISLDGREVIRGDKYRKEVSYDILVGNDTSLTMSTRDKEYLNAHNTRRKTWHERYDKVYVPLAWSASLAKDAINYAEKLLNDCEVDGIVHEENVDSGENLAKNRGSGSWAQLYPVENVRTLLMYVCV